MADTLLIVDDEPNLRFALRLVLEDAGYGVLEAGDGHEALQVLDEAPRVDLVLTDLTMPHVDGMTLLARLAETPNAPPVIMITANGNERIAVEAMQRGALDYFTKPFDEDEILRVVARNIQTARITSRCRRLRAACTLGRTMVFGSGAMEQVAEIVQRVARRDISVLITGESGTGKELVARALAEASPRADRPFVAFNCAALQDDLAASELFGHAKGAFTGAERARIGLLRQADGGTVFLDEVGDLSPRIQAALLRVLQERQVRPVGADGSLPVDVRIIAATNRDLAEADGFRRDLYYRLRGVEIRLPPLRDRPEDIAPLARHFARRAADRYGLDALRLSPSLEAALQARRWPGNVRELQHCVETLVALADDEVIGVDALALVGDPVTRRPAASSLKAQVDAFERSLLAQTLADCDGNQSEAARRLQVSRMTLSSKLKKHGLR